MILVTGATGTVGRRVLAGTRDAGHKVRALVRDPSRVTVLDDIEYVVGDLAVPDTLPAAVNGVEQVFLMAPGHQKARYDTNLIDAARRSGVRHVVALSSIAVQESDEVGVANAVARWHRESEQALLHSTMEWTILRPAGFMSNTLAWASSIRAEGVARGLAPDAAEALIDPADIAAVVVTTLLEPGHEGAVYALTGPEALSPRQRLAVLSSVVGRELRFEELSVDAQRRAMLAHSPAETVDGVLEAAEQARELRVRILPDASELLGRPPRSFRQWAQEHRHAFLSQLQ